MPTTISKRKYEDLTAKLDFADASLELDFLRKGRQVIDTASYVEEITERRGKLIAERERAYSWHEIGRATEETGKPIYELFDSETGLLIDRDPGKQKIEFVEQEGIQKIKINLGTGNLQENFRLFLKRQLQVGLDPADFIRTISQDHVAVLQRILLEDLPLGKDFAVTRKRFVETVMGKMKDREARRKLVGNVSRILRTAHSRAAASSVSLFALQNPNIISGLRRTANGRPCWPPRRSPE